MSNTRQVRDFSPIASDLQKAGLSDYTIRAIRDVLTRSDKVLTDQGAIQSVAPITGRTEGIATTAQHLTATGLVDSLDNVNEGSTYGRPLQTALTTGQVDLNKAGVIGPMGSAKLAKNVMGNYSNNATVDSIDNGTNATVRVYGPGGVGTTWHQFIGSVIGSEQPAFSGTTAYNQDTYIVYDGVSFTITTTPSAILPDGLLFCAKIHTVSAGGGGGTGGGGGAGGGGGGRLDSVL